MYINETEIKRALQLLCAYKNHREHQESLGHINTVNEEKVKVAIEILSTMLGVPKLELQKMARRVILNSNIPRTQWGSEVYKLIKAREVRIKARRNSNP